MSQRSIKFSPPGVVRAPSLHSAPSPSGRPSASFVVSHKSFHWRSQLQHKSRLSFLLPSFSPRAVLGSDAFWYDFFAFQGPALVFCDGTEASRCLIACKSLRTLEQAGSIR